VLRIARTLKRAGFETWCVGGAVRDALLGHPHLDWDLATAATPDQVRRLFRRTVPKGIKFGTVGVLDEQDVMHEVTTFRRDVRTDGRHAEVEFGASLEDDLARRDFTVNAIAMSPEDGVLRDPFDGQGDLRRKVIRAVGDPDERMREDRLRALRAIRFAARFGFRIEAATWDAIVRSAPHLGRLSRERVREELEKTMQQVERPGDALRLWQESGALATLVPALARLAPAALRAADFVPRPVGPRRDARLLHRLATLFLDLGGDGARQALRSLRFSNQQVEWIGRLAALWTSLGGGIAEALLRGDPAPVRDVEIRRWVARARRTRVASFLRVAAARWTAERAAGAAAPPARAVRSLYRRAVRIAYRDPVELSDLAVNGEDLRDAGVRAGPLLGKILELLLEDVIEDPSRNTRVWLMQRALELYGNLSGQSPEER
jgi:tRNA nucleotidyltransferase (CCA-adding enzyme)